MEEPLDENTKRRTANFFENTLDRLDKRKMHPRQSYDEVVNQILDKLEFLESKEVAPHESNEA